MMSLPGAVIALPAAELLSVFIPSHVIYYSPFLLIRPSPLHAVSLLVQCPLAVFVLDRHIFAIDFTLFHYIHV
jgi:hypothetical protein